MEKESWTLAQHPSLFVPKVVWCDQMLYTSAPWWCRSHLWVLSQNEPFSLSCFYQDILSQPQKKWVGWGSSLSNSRQKRNKDKARKWKGKFSSRRNLLLKKKPSLYRSSINTFMRVESWLPKHFTLDPGFQHLPWGFSFQHMDFGNKLEAQHKEGPSVSNQWTKLEVTAAPN